MYISKCNTFLVIGFVHALAIKEAHVQRVSIYVSRKLRLQGYSNECPVYWIYIVSSLVCTFKRKCI